MVRVLGVDSRSVLHFKKCDPIASELPEKIGYAMSRSITAARGSTKAP